MLKSVFLKSFTVLSLLTLLACSGSGGNSSALCGNNILEKGEACDDGNVVNGDACTSECQLTFASESLGQIKGTVNYLQVGKIDANTGLDLILIVSKEVEDQILWSENFLVNLTNLKDIMTFIRSEQSQSGSITRQLKAYQSGDLNQDGFLDLAYSFLEHEFKQVGKVNRLSSTLAYFKSNGGGSFNSEPLFYGTQEAIAGENQPNEVTRVTSKIRIAEVSDFQYLGSPDVIINLGFYFQDESNADEQDFNCMIKNDAGEFDTGCDGIATDLPSVSGFEIGSLNKNSKNDEVLYIGKNIYTIRIKEDLFNGNDNPPANIVTPANIVQLTIQDLSGDNLNDLVVLAGNQLIWYQNEGSPKFSALKNIASSGITHFEVGDFDGDGLNDILAFSNQGGGEIQVFPNVGNGNFGNPSTLVSQVGTITAQHLVDADEDGDLDLVYAVGSEIFFLENKI